MTGLIRYTDNQIVMEDGHTARFLLPQRAGACVDQIVGARKIRKMSICDGDITSMDAADHVGNLAAAAERCMVTFDKAASDRRPYGKPIFADLLVNFQPGPKITSWWFSFLQWNCSPLKGQAYASPPVSIGVENVNGAEFITCFARWLDDGVVQTYKTHTPLIRQQSHYEILFVDGRGQDGMFQVKLDGVVICDYSGPVGYPDYSGCYFGYGIYQPRNHKLPQPVTIHFENLCEGLI